VTSRSGKRLVVPKGCIEPGKTAGEIALLEAWEEAGLVGVLQAEPVGSYLYDKGLNTYHVLVYLMQVTQVANEWPERDQRDRLWMSYSQALVRVEEFGLRELIRGLAANKAG
jgi:8-oxo-dGTP pyrophosphatase MutT (NUDIX family)